MTDQQEEISILYPEMKEVGEILSGYWNYHEYRIKCELELVLGIKAVERNRVFAEVEQRVRRTEQYYEFKERFAEQKKLAEADKKDA